VNSGDRRGGRGDLNMGGGRGIGPFSNSLWKKEPGYSKGTADVFFKDQGDDLAATGRKRIRETFVRR